MALLGTKRSEFRKRHLAVLPDLFEQVLRLCRAAGLTVAYLCHGSNLLSSTLANLAGCEVV